MDCSGFSILCCSVENMYSSNALQSNVLLHRCYIMYSIHICAEKSPVTSVELVHRFAEGGKPV